jgi:hypothetical protein
LRPKLLINQVSYYLIIDDEKKVIYDESFNAIKNEKFGFKLPRGAKKEKP